MLDSSHIVFFWSVDGRHLPSFASGHPIATYLDTGLEHKGIEVVTVVIPLMDWTVIAFSDRDAD